MSKTNFGVVSLSNKEIVTFNFISAVSTTRTTLSDSVFDSKYVSFQPNLQRVALLTKNKIYLRNYGTLAAVQEISESEDLKLFDYVEDSNFILAATSSKVKLYSIVSNSLVKEVATGSDISLLTYLPSTNAFVYYDSTRFILEPVTSTCFEGCSSCTFSLANG